MLWSIVICGGIYGIVMLMNSEGAGGQITKIACTCGMMIVIAGQLKLIDTENIYQDFGYGEVKMGVEQGQNMYKENIIQEISNIIKQKVLDIANTKGLDCFVYVNTEDVPEIVGIELYHPSNPEWFVGDKLRGELSAAFNIPGERIRKYEK